MTWTRRIGPSVLTGLLVTAGLLAGGFYESTFSLLAALVWLGLAVAAALRPLRRPSPAVWALTGLAAWTTLSATWGATGPALRAAPLAALYAGTILAAEQVDGRALLRGAWLGCAALSALALPFYRGGRLDWPVTYANGLGVVAGAGLLLSLSRRSRPGAAVCALALVLTFSRSALLATAVGALVLLAAERRPTARVALPFAAVLAVATLALAQPLAARFAAPAPDEHDARRLLDVSGHGRDELWGAAWRQGLDAPVLGGGAGTWARRYVADTGAQAAPANAHSLPLETFAELGLAGVGLLGLFVVAAARRARPEPVALAVLAAWAVAASVDWTWQLPAATLPMLLVVGAAGPRRACVVATQSLLLGLAALAVGAACALHGIGAALLEEGRPRAATPFLPGDARPWVARGELDRACAVDPGELVLLRLSPPAGGCGR